MKEIRISVIIPVYNAENTISETLESIYSQGIEEMEVICINDGSSDSSLKAINNFKKKFKQLKVISIKNSGPGIARNKGVELARGEYITFCDSDDILPLGALKALLCVAEAKWLDIVVGRYMDRYDNGEDVYFTYNLNGKSNIYRFFAQLSSCARIYKTQFIRQNNLLFPKASQGEDRLFLARAIVCKPTIEFIDDVVYIYMHRAGTKNSLMGNRSKTAFLERIACWDEFYKTCDEGNIRETKQLFTDGFPFLAKQWKSLSTVLERRETFSAFQQFFKGKEFGLEEFCKNFGITYNEFSSCEDYDEFAQKIIETAQENDRFFKDKVEAVRETINYPLISIVIPVYNTEKYLTKCLLSIQNQTLKSFEVICVDDQSTDASRYIIDLFCTIDSRFHCVQGNGMGAGAARNIGMNDVKGKYLLFLDSDDFFCDDMLMEAYVSMEKEDLDVCVWNGYEFNNATGKVAKESAILRTELVPQEKVFAGTENKYLFNMTSGAPWNKMYRLSYYKGQNVRYMEQTCFNDLFVVYILLAKAKRISVIKKQKMYYRVNNSSSLQGGKDKNISDAFCAFNMVYDRLKADGLWEFDNVRISYMNYLLSCTSYIISSSHEYDSFEKAFNYIQDCPIMRGLNEENVFDFLRGKFEEYTFISNCSISRYQHELRLKLLNTQDELRKNLQKSQNQIQKIDELRKQGKADYKSVKEVNVQLRTDLAYYQHLLTETRNSFTYKIGRFITYLPRLLRHIFTKAPM